MSTRAQRGLLAALVLTAAGFLVFRYAGSTEEREIRRSFNEFTDDFNASANGLGAVARAARLATYFTPDVVVELGDGSPPIHGRETLIGMAARLQPRTAAFVLELDDVNVELVDEAHANVVLTAVIRQNRPDSRDGSIDAREFAADVRKSDGQWRISRVVAVDTLR